MDFERIIDSHTHWGHSLSMGTTVTTGELLAQQKDSGVTNVILIPFPSTAIASNEINIKVLEETGNRIDPFSRKRVRTVSLRRDPRKPQAEFTFRLEAAS